MFSLVQVEHPLPGGSSWLLHLFESPSCCGGKGMSEALTRKKEPPLWP